MENSYWKVPTFGRVQRCFAIRPKNKRCVTLWTCHLHFKMYLKAKIIDGNLNISPGKK
jgi:hypothetical protein